MVPTNPAGLNHGKDAALRVVPGSTACLCLALNLSTEGKLLPHSGHRRTRWSRARVRAGKPGAGSAPLARRTGQPGPARRLRPRVTSPGAGRADAGDEDSARAAPDHFSPGTWGPDKVCSCLSLFTVGVGGRRHLPPPHKPRSRSSPPRKQFPSAGGSTLFSLSPPEPFHLSLTFPGPS